LQDAEDVVALTFFEAWRMREHVRAVDGSLLPWLLSVTAKVALNFTRAQHRYRSMLSRLPPALDEDDHANVVADRIAHASRVQRILLALKNLAPGDRAVVDLCLIEELPMDAAAKVLAVPSGTVKSRLHRARRQLRLELEDVHAVMGDYT
jgi:RNA polymerase sigma-70 factor (ECF subfamily)